jgi:hypothetical protein
MSIVSDRRGLGALSIRSQGEYTRSSGQRVVSNRCACFIDGQNIGFNQEHGSRNPLILRFLKGFYLLYIELRRLSWVGYGLQIDFRSDGLQLRYDGVGPERGPSSRSVLVGSAASEVVVRHAESEHHLFG